MTKLGSLWTNSIAYVALAVGAGLSIMYNVVDTIQVRGDLFDRYDLITAVSAPGIVVLMVEMFVSRWWIGRPWYMQIVRSLACAAIGGSAMRASWTHGHDFMASRGQTDDVAITWPLAIDLLAIMATALILAGRRTPTGHGHGGMANALDTVAMAIPSGGTGLMATATDVAKSEAAPRGHEATTHGHEAALCPDRCGHETPDRPGHVPGIDWDTELANFDLNADRAIRELGRDIGVEAEQYLAATSEQLPQRRTATPASTPVPQEARELLQAWDGQTHTGRAVDALLAAYFGRSERTARRWRTQVLGPASSPPAP